MLFSLGHQRCCPKLGEKLRGRGHLARNGAKGPPGEKPDGPLRSSKTRGYAVVSLPEPSWLGVSGSSGSCVCCASVVSVIVEP